MGAVPRKTLVKLTISADCVCDTWAMVRMRMNRWIAAELIIEDTMAPDWNPCMVTSPTTSYGRGVCSDIYVTALCCVRSA